MGSGISAHYFVRARSALRSVVRRRGVDGQGSRPKTGASGQTAQHGPSDAVAREDAGEARDTAPRVATETPRLALAIDLETTHLEPGLQSTPMNVEQRAAYKFYCPICMGWFKAVLKTECCGHQICRSCLLQYLATVMDGKMNDLPNHIPANLACCHCARIGFTFTAIATAGASRSYDDDPEAPALAVHMKSPIRIGDSFDDLKRKMLFFDSAPGEEDFPCACDMDRVASDSQERLKAKQFVGEVMATAYGP